MADSLQQVREEMHTAINGRLRRNQQHLQCHAEDLSRSCRSSQAVQNQGLDPEELGGQSGQSQFRNFMGELHLWMQARLDQGERILVRVKGVDKVERLTLAVDCTEAIQNVRDRSVPDPAQDENK